MWISCSTPSKARGADRGAAAALVLAGALACSTPGHAQHLVFDPKNHLENALQAARQLESLTNQAQMLANQARELASSPYSHLGETGQVLADISSLAASAKGLAFDVEGLQADFAQVYPMLIEGLDPQTALKLRKERNLKAMHTAEDLARVAAELEQMAKARPGRVMGALGASQSASGQTAAIQSSTQILAVLAEDLLSMQTILAAQSRLMAQEAARTAAERSAGAEARRQFWAHDGAMPANPDFDPLPYAKN